MDGWLVNIFCWATDGFIRRVPGNGYVGVSQALQNGQGGVFFPTPNFFHMSHWKGTLVNGKFREFQASIFRKYVSFQGCNKLEWFKFTFFWWCFGFSDWFITVLKMCGFFWTNRRRSAGLEKVKTTKDCLVSFADGIAPLFHHVFVDSLEEMPNFQLLDNA